MKFNSTLATLFLSFAFCIENRGASSPAPPLIQRDYWPTKEWKTTAREDHGLDTNSLAAAITQLQSLCPPVRSLLVVRHGRLIVERYFNGSTKDEPGNIKSASKSILSALVGIALEQGFIRSIDQPVIDFFPEYRDQLGDPRKKQITLRHLLTMSAGLEYVENGPISRRWMASRDWHGFTLKSKLVAEPGAEFNYSTALTHLLSGVITRATGTNTLAFAKRVLLDPIGASVAQWDQDPRGNYWGGSEVHLTPRSMAKFGYLYLNHGQWDGNQIVPAAWIQASTQQTNAARYGFLWWLDNFEDHSIYFAQGLGGQYILVVPDLDVVVVVTCWYASNVSVLSCLKLFVLPCIARFNPAGSLPPVGEIINRYYEAIGGREELAKLKSLRITGTVQIPAQHDRGTFELLKGGGGRIYQRVTLSKNKLGAFGSDGNLVWSTYPKGYRLLSGDEARPWREDGSAWLDLRGPLEGAKTVALTPFEGRLCYEVQSIGTSGEVLTDFFDRATGLLMGSIRPEGSPSGWLTVTRLFDEYRPFGRFQFPTKVVSHVQGPEMVWTRDKIEYDTISPRAFGLPIAIQDILNGKRGVAR
jgi:CubicO group peptidase (beta-lactamase class C family)